MTLGEEYVTNPGEVFRHTVLNASPSAPCKVALFSSEAVSKCLISGDVEATLDYNAKLAVVRRIFVFRYISNHHCDLLVRAFKMVKKAEGELVFAEGDMGSQFYVIKSGEVLVSKEGKTLRTLGKFDYFGERSLLNDEPRSASVSCHKGQVELWVIDKTVFLQIVEGQMLNHLEERIRLQDTNF